MHAQSRDLTAPRPTLPPRWLADAIRDCSLVGLHGRQSLERSTPAELRHAQARWFGSPVLHLEPDRADGAYKYTPINQLCYAASSNGSACSSPPSGSIAYKYDAADNLIQAGSTQQTFNAADELCWTASTSGSCASPPTGATNYSYDTRGNRTAVTPSAGQAVTLTYDQANRLTNYGAASTTTYAYNADGLRMSKTSGGTTTQFAWDVAGGLPLLLKDGTTAYVYGPGGLPLEQISGSTTYYLHHDQIGSTRLLTDASGTVQGTYTFDSYGRIVASTGSVSNPLLFAGQYLDSESTLYYSRARYYDPATGQFVSRDPVSSTTLEPYGYVRGNPLNFADPTGLFGWNDVWNGAKKAAHAVLEVASLAPYATYYTAYRTDSTIIEFENALPPPLGVAVQALMGPVHGGLEVLQVLGLADDIEIDALKHFVGGEPQLNDEGINGHILPFNNGPVWYLPGWHTDDPCHVDFSWNHPFGWGHGFGPVRPHDRP